MDEKTKSEAWYKMWRNFCVSDSYEPGSPQKAFTVAGAIEEGAISGNEVFECGGNCISETGISGVLPEPVTDR